MAGGTRVVAGTLMARTVGELAQEADLIIMGKVQAVLPTEHPTGEPATSVVIDVARSWKTLSPAKVRVIQPVGTVEGIRQQVPGLPSFEIGEDVIVFLVESSAGEYEVLHGKEGKLKVVADPQSHRLMVQDVTDTLADLSEVLRQF
jgi:hypothetical protein